jgi:hypothetical protein
MNALELLKRTYPESYPTKPYGGGNPYHYCSHCRVSNIDISMRGHSEYCEWAAARKMISDLESSAKNKLSTKEARLTIAVLRYCADILGRKICNDLPEHIAKILTREEWDDMNKRFHIYNGDPEEYRPGDPPLQDFALAAFIAHRIKSTLPEV